MRLIHYFQGIYQKLMDKSYSTLAGAIAFFLIINVGSIIYLMVLVSKIFNLEIELSIYFFRIIATNIENIGFSNNLFYSLFFIGTNIYCASSLFFHLLRMGEVVYGQKNRKINLMRRLIAIIFMTVVVFIIEMSFVLLYLSKFFFVNSVWVIIRYLLFIIIPYIISVCIHLFITPKEVKFKDINKGAIITCLFWYISSILFLLFTSIFKNYKAIYGTLSVYVVFMIWIYLIAQGLVIGVIYNYYYKEKNVKIFCMDNVQNITGTPQKENYEKI